MKKKLQENKGITIVLALGIFLVATILSAVIVSVSLNNAQRIQRQRDEQQANLAISSAAGFMIELLDGAKAVYIDEGGTADKWEFNYDDCLLKEPKYSDLKDDFESFIKNGGSINWTIDSEDGATGEAISVDVEVNVLSTDFNDLLDRDMKINIKKTSNKNYLDGKFSQTLNLKAATFVDDVDNPENYKEYTWHYLSLDRNGED